jgi:hypothetical protein
MDYGTNLGSLRTENLKIEFSGAYPDTRVSLLAGRNMLPGCNVNRMRIGHLNTSLDVPWRDAVYLAWNGAVWNGQGFHDKLEQIADGPLWKRRFRGCVQLLVGRVFYC